MMAARGAAFRAVARAQKWRGLIHKAMPVYLPSPWSEHLLFSRLLSNSGWHTNCLLQPVAPLSGPVRPKRGEVRSGQGSLPMQRATSSGLSKISLEPRFSSDLNRTLNDGGVNKLNIVKDTNAVNGGRNLLEAESWERYRH